LIAFIEILGSRDSEVFEELLKFLYTGRSERVNDIVRDLLKAAKKFQIQDLKEFWGNILFNEITNDNAIETLTIANDNCNPGLKDETIDYIVVNNSIIYKGSDNKWREFSDKYPGLVPEIVNAIARKSIVTSCEYKCKYKTRIIKNNSKNS
jgi:hypothetical protein